MVVITGCPRSGTSYITHLLRELGYSTAGEKMRKVDILVAWQVAGQKDYIVDPVKLSSKRNLFFDKIMDMSVKVLHQTREPLKTIMSIYNQSNVTIGEQRERYWKHICSCIPKMKMSDSVLTKSIKFWYYWNLLAEEISSYRYRIEDISDEIYEIIKIANGYLDKDVFFDKNVFFEMPTNYNTCYKSEKKGELSDKYRFFLTWDDVINATSVSFCDDVRELAENYGYETSWTQIAEAKFTKTLKKYRKGINVIKE